MMSSLLESIKRQARVNSKKGELGFVYVEDSLCVAEF